MVNLPSAVEILSALNRTPICFAPTPRTPPTPMTTPSIWPPWLTIRSSMVPTVSPLLLMTLAPSNRSLARYWLAVWPLKKVFLGISTFLVASVLGSSFFCARAGAASAAETRRARASLCI
jgi:hypothetical protein